MKKLSPMEISAGHLKLNKVDKLFYNNEGVKKADEGKFKEAVEYFTKAIELLPEDSLSYFNRATVKINLGDILGAKLDFASSESFQLSINHLNKLGMN